MYSPTHYYMRVSRVEPSEVLDVPSILDGHPVLRLQVYGARPGDAGNPERTLPHGRELVKALLERTRLRMRSPTSRVREWMLWQW